MARSAISKQEARPITANHIDVENQTDDEHNDHIEMDQEQQQSGDHSAQVIDNDDSANANINNNNNNNNINVNNNYNHQCYICDKIFSANSNLNRHLRKIHKENVQSPYNNVKCALCESVFPSSCIYNDHLVNHHQVKIEIENLTFENGDMFSEWKHGIENETTSQFIKSRGEKRTKNVNKTYYSCNRSGYYVSKARTQKALKKQGSRKINGRCPASMIVTINPDSGYDVRFVKTHVGHDFELKHIDLSDKDRDLIVQKITAGLTKKDIIRQLRSNAANEQANNNIPESPSSISLKNGCVPPIVIGRKNSLPDGGDQIEVIQATTSELILANQLNNQSSTTSSATTPIPSTTIDSSQQSISSSSTPNVSLNSKQTTSRIHLATTKDLHNILNSKHLNPKKIRHNYDLKNFEAWISEMKEYGEKNSSVLFYKDQNELSDKFPKLVQDDFMLVIMNYGQSQILKNYGEKCIVIDSTHNVHCEYLQLAYVSVVDDDRRGFPVAFMFSSRTDADTFEVFFTLLKERVGLITTRMFIADEMHDFYQAWWRVMSMPAHNLLTPWSAFDTWSKKFNLINGREKLRKLKKQLRSLLTEPELDKFTRIMKQMLNDYKDDSDVKQFMEYFETNFSRNPDLWSCCLRKNYGVANYQLWSTHEKFKSVYKTGKNSKNLCRFLYSLMNLYEDHQMEKMSQLQDQIDPSEQREGLIKRHRRSLEGGPLVYEVAVEPVYWLCPSEGASEGYYEVRHNPDMISTVDNSTDSKEDNRQADGGSSPKRKKVAETSPETEKAPEETVTRDRISIDLPTPTEAATSDPTPKTTPTTTTTTTVTFKKCCEVKCPDCSSCRHQYKCTCLDYVVNLSMCKHIHRICTMCK